MTIDQLRQDLIEKIGARDRLEADAQTFQRRATAVSVDGAKTAVDAARKAHGDAAASRALGVDPNADVTGAAKKLKRAQDELETARATRTAVDAHVARANDLAAASRRVAAEARVALAKALEPKARQRVLAAAKALGEAQRDFFALARGAAKASADAGRPVDHPIAQTGPDSILHGADDSGVVLVLRQCGLAAARTLGTHLDALPNQVPALDETQLLSLASEGGSEGTSGNDESAGHADRPKALGHAPADGHVTSAGASSRRLEN